MDLNKGISTPIAILLIIAVSAVVGVLVWQFTKPAEEPTPKQASDYTTQAACKEAGFYWYDNACRGERQSTTQETIEPQDKLTLAEVKNAKYSSTSLKKEPFQLKNGYYEKSYPKSASKLKINIYERKGNKKIAFGNLNNDSRKDAAVILESSAGGSGSFRDLIILINKNGAPFQLATKNLGDRVTIKSVDIRKGRIILDMIVHDDQDALCCPSLHKLFEYKLSGDQLKLVKERQPEKGTKIADWKTYTSEEYGFEFKYPENWRGISTSSEQMGTNFLFLLTRDRRKPVEKSLQFSLSIYEDKNMAQSEALKKEPIETERKDIASESTEIFTYSDDFQGPHDTTFKMSGRYAWLEKDNLHFLLDGAVAGDMDDWLEKKELFSKMLSTFKFTK